MMQNPAMDALKGVVDILQPLSSDERLRIFRAALLLLGDDAPSREPDSLDESSLELPPRARAWMKQNAVTAEVMGEVFHIANGGADIIASHLPGKSKKEQTLNAYILTGIARFLVTGEMSFDDKVARELCEKFGCHDRANHSAILKDKGNEFTGAKEKGWTLTAPGLKRGADLIKGMANLKA